MIGLHQPKKNSDKRDGRRGGGPSTPTSQCSVLPRRGAFNEKSVKSGFEFGRGRHGWAQPAMEVMGGWGEESLCLRHSERKHSVTSRESLH
jgi:hypothetical protein